MPAIPDRVYYKLGPELTQLVQDYLTAQQELVTEIKNTPDKSDKLDLVRKFQEQHQDTRQQLGLETTTIHVNEGIQKYPRAYNVAPYILPSLYQSSSDLCMCSPIDYKGNHFKPYNSQRLDEEKDKKALNAFIGGGGWLDNYPIMSAKEHGAVLPSDFVPTPISELKEKFTNATNGHVVFIAQGKSKEHIADYMQRKADWEQTPHVSADKGPSLSDYPELIANYSIAQNEITKMLGTNGYTPRVENLQNQTLLIYTASFDGKDTSFCPPDAIRIPTELYHWLKDDDFDMQIRIKPPPIPDEAIAIMNQNQLSANTKPALPEHEPSQK